MSNPPKGPMVFDLSEDKDPEQGAAQAPGAFQTSAEDLDPARAPMITDLPEGRPEGAAMQAATRLAARRISWFGRLFWAALVSLLLLYVSTAAWDFAFGLFERNIWLGRAAVVLGAVVGAALLLFALREVMGLAALSRIDGFRRKADALRTEGTPKEAKDFTRRLSRIYRGRPEMEWHISNLQSHKEAVMDAPDLLDLTETALLGPLDTAARAEIETAARSVAAATAIVPLALADVFVALSVNVAMVRRIAQIYGGRSGALGSWRLIRAVSTHLIATGAVGVADDMISSVAGGGLAAKLSRRFGEGVVNGALTARVGLAAMDVCRPMPFIAHQRPGVTSIVQSALTGMFSGLGGKKQPGADQG